MINILYIRNISLIQADKLGTEKIDEDGLLELIRTKPAKKAGKSCEPAPTRKAFAKRKSDTPPIPVDSFPVTSKVKSSALVTSKVKDSTVVSSKVNDSTLVTSKVKGFYSSKQENSNKTGHVTSVKTDEEGTSYLRA